MHSYSVLRQCVCDPADPGRVIFAHWPNIRGFRGQTCSKTLCLGRVLLRHAITKFPFSRKRSCCDWPSKPFFFLHNAISPRFSKAPRTCCKTKWSLWTPKWKPIYLWLEHLKKYGDQREPRASRVDPRSWIAKGWRRNAALPIVKMRALLPPKQ